MCQTLVNTHEWNLDSKCAEDTEMDKKADANWILFCVLWTKMSETCKKSDNLKGGIIRETCIRIFKIILLIQLDNDEFAKKWWKNVFPKMQSI